MVNDQVSLQTINYFLYIGYTTGQYNRVLNYMFNKAKLPIYGSFMQESGRNLFWNWEKKKMYSTFSL